MGAKTNQEKEMKKEEFMKIIATQLKLQKETNNATLEGGKKVILELRDIKEKYDAIIWQNNRIIKNQDELKILFRNADVIEVKK